MNALINQLISQLLSPPLFPFFNLLPFAFPYPNLFHLINHFLLPLDSPSLSLLPNALKSRFQNP